MMETREILLNYLYLVQKVTKCVKVALNDFGGNVRMLSEKPWYYLIYGFLFEFCYFRVL